MNFLEIWDQNDLRWIFVEILDFWVFSVLFLKLEQRRTSSASLENV